jgi:anti-sigma28 factor (negative regulator of flagellin synthesis)
MRENTRDWQRWRVTAAVTAPTPAVPRYTRPILNTASPAAAEQPGPDGIRHELVARVRQEIAAGTYDTDEKWLAAEERLFARIEAGM